MNIILALCLLAAPPSLYVEVNAYRVQVGLNPLIPDTSLEHAAELQCEWHGVAGKLFPPGADIDPHSTLTAWLLAEHPELDWGRLYATYGPVLPDWLNWHDRARLCGWEGGATAENGYLWSGGKPKPWEVVAGWARSPGHRRNLEGDWLFVGFAEASKSRALFCEFGE
jgi:hypothetical protein